MGPSSSLVVSRKCAVGSVCCQLPLTRREGQGQSAAQAVHQPVAHGAAKGHGDSQAAETGDGATARSTVSRAPLLTLPSPSTQPVRLTDIWSAIARERGIRPHSR